MPDYRRQQGIAYSKRVPLARDSKPGEPRYYWEKLAREVDENGSVCPSVGLQDMGSTGQWMNAIKHLNDVPTARRSADEATEAAQSRFPRPEQHNGAGDAYRHFLWNSKMTRSIGSGAAAGFANSHEVSGDDPAPEHRMDLYNNAVGRAMAQDPRFSSLSPEDLAEIAYRYGCLQITPK